LEISVTDTGIGIREEDIPRLFQAFTQLESVYTKGFEGTGLGLALTRQLVELHGGRIWMESEFGTGSTFIFTIPLTQTAGKPALDIRPAVPRNGNTVLVIENDPLTLSALKIALQSKGYQVLKTSNGVHGIAMAVSERPDLIILDLMMPGVSGFDVAELLHTEPATTHTPILVLTAMDLSADDRARLTEKVWRIAEKGSLSTHNLLSLVESAIGSN
jgi:CheY-like chemotaxis protein